MERSQLAAQRPEWHTADAEAAHLAAALADDAEAFRALVDPYMRELHVHCYRLLGSLRSPPFT